MNTVDSARADLRCSVLLLFVTSTEMETLEEAAVERGLTFEKRSVRGPHSEKVEFFSLGMLGCYTVNAVRTKEGPLSYGGSASRAIYYRTITGASEIIQIGMAFGVNPQSQKIGDILVSTSLIPYDKRVVKDARESIEVPPPEGEIALQVALGATTSDLVNAASSKSEVSASDVRSCDNYVVDYSKAKRHPAKASLVNLFRNEATRTADFGRTAFGGMLSGGARISSRRFLGELVKGVPQAEDGVIGGEMEGVGLLSLSPPKEPMWIVVKGISDFADGVGGKVFEENRVRACKNAAHFVLSALINARRSGTGGNAHGFA